MDYFKKLGYTEDPDYEMCKRKLLNVLKKEKSKFDYIYDWTTLTNLQDRNRLKKNTKNIQKMLSFDASNIKERRHATHRNYTSTHHLEDNEDDEDINIVELEDNSEKEEDSSLSNRADIDEADSPGLNPNNETECCLVF